MRKLFGVMLFAATMVAGGDGIDHLENKERLPQYIAGLFEKIEKGDALDSIETFSTLGEIGAPALPYLLEYLNDPNKSSRESCADALGSIGPDAAGAVPALVKALADPNAEVREYAASALGRIASQKEIALPALKKSLADANPRVNFAASLAILNMDPADGIALAKLKESIRHKDEGVRSSTLLNLKDYPLIAKSVIPELIKAVDDSHPNVQKDAMRILSDVGAAEAVPNIIPMLQHPDEFTRWSAIEALGKLGPKAVKAVPALTATLGTSILPFSPKAREEMAKVSNAMKVATPESLNLASPAAIALESIQPGSLGAQQVLRHALKDPMLHATERIDALACLAAKPEEKAALDYILNYVKHEDRDIRAHAGLALAKLGRIEGLAALEEELVVTNTYRRLSAAKAIGDLGPAARSAIPALEKATRNLLQAQLAKEAKAALDKIKK